MQELEKLTKWTGRPEQRHRNRWRRCLETAKSLPDVCAWWDKNDTRTPRGFLDHADELKKPFLMAVA